LWRWLTRLVVGVEINLLQLIHQVPRRIPIAGEVAGRHRDSKTLVGSVTELRHDLAGLRAVLLDIGVISRQGSQEVRRHPPQPARRRLHRPADLALARSEDVDERLAIETERHGTSQTGIIEGRSIAIDDQIAADIGGEYLADRVRRLVFDVL